MLHLCDSPETALRLSPLAVCTTQSFKRYICKGAVGEMGDGKYASASCRPSPKLCYYLWEWCCFRAPVWSRVQSLKFLQTSSPTTSVVVDTFLILLWRGVRGAAVAMPYK